MDTGQKLERLRNSHPARQDGNVGDEADVAHQLIAFLPRVPPENSEFAFIGSEAEDRVERRGFAGAVRTDEAQNSTLFNPQVNAIERDGCAERLAQPACFYACHGQRSSSSE